MYNSFVCLKYEQPYKAKHKRDSKRNRKPDRQDRSWEILEERDGIEIRQREYSNKPECETKWLEMISLQKYSFKWKIKKKYVDHLMFSFGYQ